MQEEVTEDGVPRKGEAAERVELESFEGSRRSEWAGPGQVYGRVGSRRTVCVEVETKTSMVLCLWDVEGAVKMTALGGASYGAFTICWLSKPSLSSRAPQHSRMTGKILSTKWIVLVTDFSHVLLLILLFLLLLKSDPSANDHSWSAQWMLCPWVDKIPVHKKLAWYFR